MRGFMDIRRWVDCFGTLEIISKILKVTVMI